MPAPTAPSTFGHTIDRRTALTALGAITAGAGLTSAALAQPGKRADRINKALGWDPASGTYTLPPLPYAYDALEPHIDAQTMHIHHDKHHAGYVRKLNAALKALDGLRSGSVDAGQADHLSHELSFNGGGHINHTLFWLGMAPPSNGGGGAPSGSLAHAITRDFGSFDRFKSHFIMASTSVKGSGWGWLCFEPVSRRLIVTHMHNQEGGLFAGLVPLLGVDVWEHAYYLRYQNRRSDYVNAFFNVINWGHVQAMYEDAMG